MVKNNQATVIFGNPQWIDSSVMGGKIRPIINLLIR
jgi:hypothetical protein